VSRFARFLDSQETGVFSRQDLDDLLRKHGSTLKVPPSLRVSRLIDVLLDEQPLREIELQREGRSSLARGRIRYAWGDASPYAIGVSLFKGSYLTHASAMFLHALTDQVPKTIYVNREQSPKPRSSEPMTQASINRAFKRPPRTSSSILLDGQARYVLLNGKRTNRLEVSPMRTSRGEVVAATRLERTLIDIAVRPTYAGGLHEVLRAYQTAAERLSINTLIATLKRLDYLYPYHQAIGFMLERAGISENKLSPLRALGFEWDFYLAHQMSDPDYSSRWRLFYPKGL
jgi:hypothetical protein